MKVYFGTNYKRKNKCKKAKKEIFTFPAFLYFILLPYQEVFYSYLQHRKQHYHY